MVAVGGKVGWGIGVAVGSGVVLGVITAVSVVTASRGAFFVGTATLVSFRVDVAVGSGAGWTTERAQIFREPKHKSISKNGMMVMIVRLRLERRCGVVSDSSIAAAF